MKVDFGRAARDYGEHRRGYPDKAFQRLERIGVPLGLQRVVDLGTGTGLLARALARRGASVTAVDPAQELLDEAARLDRAARVEVRYVRANAEDTGLPARSFRVATAGQCWCWFDDEAVLREVRRLVVAGGWLILLTFEWLPRSRSVGGATQQLILRFNPSWTMAGGSGWHPEWVAQLERAGLEAIESFSFDVDEPFTHETWRGRVRAGAGVETSLTPEEVVRFDRELAELLRVEFPHEPVSVPHRLYAVTCRIP